jgi:hypothetical protein
LNDLAQQQHSLGSNADTTAAGAGAAAAAAAGSSFTMRLAALSMFPVIEAFERRQAPAEAPASPLVDTALRSNLLNLLLDMLERLPTSALSREPSDVLDAYAKYGTGVCV